VRAPGLKIPETNGVETTFVRCHNAWGRVYLALIAQFHRSSVISNLKRSLKIRELGRP